MRTLSRSALCLSLLLAAVPRLAAQPPEPLLHDGEELRYEWHMGGFVGVVARLFLPGQGDGALLTGHNDRGNLVSELRVTSPHGRDGEFWMYGAEIDPQTQRTLEAWTSQFFRGEAREKRADLRQESVIDLTSGIHLLRQDPPREPRRMTIWSDGKFYPVTIQPTGIHSERLFGQPVEVRSYAIRGVREEGQRQWKGKLDLDLADDAASTPVEIRIVRGGVRVRLKLLESGSRRAGDESGDPPAAPTTLQVD